MSRLVVLFMVLLLSSVSVRAQLPERGNLNLLSESYQNSPKPTVVYVQGQLEGMYEYLERNNGIYRHSFGAYHSLLLPANKIQGLLNLNAVDRIILESGKGVPMLNESRKVSRSHRPIMYKGTEMGPYLGRGVVVGIIDTGIDFTHPDFQTDSGKTRVVKIWDQSRNIDTTLRPSYGYGEVYDSSHINAGTCPHVDPNAYHGHGTMVSGIAVGNGNSVPDSIADYSGYASESPIVFVASDFNSNNWSLTIADAVDWIYKQADAMGMPCVINLSAGSYLGSHDGNDLAAMYIDSLIKEKSGRALVCAAGNAGSQANFHLRAEMQNDTSFTWFTVNPNSGFGSAVFSELWADTADFNGLTFSYGETDTSTWTDSTYLTDVIQNRLDTLMVTNLSNGAQVMTWAERQGGQYLIQFLTIKPPSGKYFKLATWGTGAYDCWSASWLGHSNMVQMGLPSSGQYANIAQYQMPDSLQSIVSSWNCHPDIISVANFNNRFEYENVDGGMRQTVDLPVGGRGSSSSRGPNRNGDIKPDLAAPGNFTVTTGRMADIAILSSTPSQRYKLAKGGFHFSNGGTSMAAPVISGLVARYFEKCPNASQEDVMRHLKSTSYSDSLTGNLPNYEFGFGKIDGHALLMASHVFDTLITSSSSLEFCEGDSLELMLGTSSNTVTSWENGSTASSQWVDSSNYNQVWKAYFQSQHGCMGYTDTAKLALNLNPDVELIADSVFCLEDGDTLTAHSTDTNVQWLWSTQDTGSSIIISTGGNYWVQGNNNSGCSNSDSAQVEGILCYVSVEGQEHDNSILIYPNPVSDQLTVELGGDDGASIEIINNEGRIVHRLIVEMDRIVVSMAQFKPGFYTLRIKHAEGSTLHRVVVLNR